MKIIFLSKRFRIMIIIFCSVAIFATCVDNNRNEVVITNNEGEQFAGSANCENCHREIYQSFLKTAHFHTSQPPSNETILGSFEKGNNLFSFSYYAKVAMEERDNGLYQVEYDKNFNEKKRHRFDIVIGSGTRGQSYLTWVKSGLVQLPVSYFTSADSWANSPGFPDYQPLFNRIISGRCLECHSTYFKAASFKDTLTPEFDRNQIVFGVQCESCHGPASSHVKYQQKYPDDTLGKFIDNPIIFTRQQNLDLCGFCHGGIRQSEKPAFSFSPGDALSDYFKHDTSTASSRDVEVHGNQYGLLTKSKCFQMSKSMTCNSCHNTHKQERGNVVYFPAGV